jgi:hypothetical protein
MLRRSRPAEAGNVAQGERRQTALRLPEKFIQQLSHTAIDRKQSLNEMLEAVLVDWYNAQPESQTYGKAAPRKVAKRGPKGEKGEEDE